MSEGFPYADILILALIAVFILLRLRSVLGNKPDNDSADAFRREVKRPLVADPEPIIQLEGKSLSPKFREEEDTAAAAITDSSITQSIIAIKAGDPQFSVTAFLEGAKRAFEMVFDAFAKGDKTTLKMLLSDSLYDTFCKEIDARGKEENKTETTLVSVAPKEVTQASIDKTRARIGIHFASEQVTIVRNPNGEIIEGNASDIHHVEDHWLFERDITSKNPNWKIIET